MWLFTTSGFYSIVKHRTDPDTFMIRARVKGDLENLRSLTQMEQPVITTPDADYPFRLIVSGAQKAQVIEALGEAVDYPNFKSAVGKLQGQRAKLTAYHDVWHTMTGTEEAGARQVDQAEGK